MSRTTVALGSRGLIVRDENPRDKDLRSCA
jgi:hypothetical protein